MSVRNAGKAIREARIKAGLTQEKLSDGICSTLSLSRIENCTAGVSPSTFHALMSRAGAECEAFPTFASRTDFDCFYTLKRARFYLEAWQFEDAYHQLMSVQDMNWADNRFYYQEWLLLQYRIQFHNHSQEHEYLYDLLTEAFLISYPEFNIDMINSLLLSTVELEILIGLAQECYYLGQTDRCGYLCAQIEFYLQNSQFTTLEKERFLAQNAIVYTKYLLAQKDYEKALEVADQNRHQMVINSETSLFYELTFLTSLGYYYIGDIDKFSHYFHVVFYSCHAIKSNYATLIKNYVIKHLTVSLDDDLLHLEEIPFINYPFQKNKDASLLHDGIFDSCSTTIMYLGDLIHELRIEQKVSQHILCQGLCSKSKLSKIENNYLQPDITLARALLQRLGYSDRVFTFWGDDREHQINTFQTRIRTKVYVSPEKNLYYYNQLESLISPDNKLEQQQLLLHKLHFNTSSQEKVLIAYKALHITLPDFEFTHIMQYRLSWTELTLLNIICINSDNNYITLINYNYLLEYFRQNNLDFIYTRTLFPITISHFIQSLYLQKHYSEILSLKNTFTHPALYHSILFLGNILGYYCQVLGESGNMPTAIQYSNYAYGIIELTELHMNAEPLKKFLYDDFHIKLNF